MSELPPLPRDQRKIDENHLNLLAVFHFAGAGLAVFGLLFLAGHYAFMHALFANPRMWDNQKGGPPPEQLFAFFKWFYLAFAIWFVSSCLLNMVSGFCLVGRKWRMFSVVVAAIDCLHVPLGTVLGVFTILVLVRESVRELYEARKGQPKPADVPPDSDRSGSELPSEGPHD